MMGIDWNLAHFAQGEWLWLLLLPLPIALFRFILRKKLDQQRYRDYADPALLKHLLRGRVEGPIKRFSWLWMWSLLWCLLVVAMAGPRWDFIDIEFAQSEANLLILLDISRSMDVSDVSPSRMKLARREIGDLIALAQQGGRNVRIGLVAFSTTAHVVTPITDDMAALNYVLPYLNTGLSQQGGSRLLPALRTAMRLIEGGRVGKPLPQTDILLVSDGDFAEPGLNQAVAQIKQRGLSFHVLAVGTSEGGPVLRKVVKDGKPRLEALFGPDGEPVQSRLPRAAMQALADSGGGIYMQADALGRNPQRLLAQIDARLQRSEQAASKGVRHVWNERFFWLLGLVLLLILPWYWPRRGRQV